MIMLLKLDICWLPPAIYWLMRRVNYEPLADAHDQLAAELALLWWSNMVVLWNPLIVLVLVSGRNVRRAHRSSITATISTCLRKFDVLLLLIIHHSLCIHSCVTFCQSIRHNHIYHKATGTVIGRVA
jgi:hypothetical protein